MHQRKNCRKNPCTFSSTDGADTVSGVNTAATSAAVTSLGFFSPMSGFTYSSNRACITSKSFGYFRAPCPFLNAIHSGKTAVIVSGTFSAFSRSAVWTSFSS